MSLKDDIQKAIDNPPTLHRDSSKPYVEIKSRIDNIHALLIKLAEAIENINSRLSNRGL